ncbi:hypothetical protein [Limnoglobus roseus]|uniref:Uncharacterized protein n=1 Tax=Limnoglobus roseus TaxID=2598579 RepID=A0A5C1AFS5_9BACT|nr:hypothetical protein [Limnoglobus roseus]QEL17670.1 hypothetical protein PX52LOC_04668 [Limnoglobus roseus]
MAGDTGKGVRHESIALQSNSAEGGVMYSDNELRFLRAVDAYKAKNRVKFPTAVDLLRVAVQVGYRPPEDVPHFAPAVHNPADQIVRS